MPLFSFSRAVADVLVALNPDILLDHPEDESALVHVYWYSTPRFFVLEWLLLHAILIVPVLWVLSQFAWPVLLPARARVHKRKPTSFESMLNAAELISSLGILGCSIALVYYKIVRPPTAYLFMLCHMHTFLLTYLRFGATADIAHSKLFHAGFMCSWFGTMLALAMPDVRGLWFGEIVLFYVQHVLLLVVPMLWIAQRRYTLYGGLAPIIIGWLVYLIVQYDLQFAVSLFSTANVSYMLVPPIGPLRLFGPYYRLAFAAAALPMGLLCLGLVRAIAWLSGGFRQAAIERAYARVLESLGDTSSHAGQAATQALARTAAAEAMWAPPPKSASKEDPSAGKPLLDPTLPLPSSVVRWDTVLGHGPAPVPLAHEGLLRQRNMN